jgi:acyl phosphate:glycerol-3-phosphate acyltransferase
MFFHKAALVGLSYLAGGIPTGYLVVKRLRGYDIRERGSGNPGTANVYRIAGAGPGAITLFVDALKGYLPVMLAARAYPGDLWLPMACGAAAIIGHDWTIFLGFRGGKGVATSAGVFAALAPKALACTIAVFAAGVWLTGHISVGSMASSVALPAFNLLFGDPVAVAAMSAVSSALILYKHVPNIKRLLERKELHLREKK